MIRSHGCPPESANIDELLEAARTQIERLEPVAALAATEHGALLKGAYVGAVAKPIDAAKVERQSPDGVRVVAEHSTLTNELVVGALYERVV